MPSNHTNDIATVMAALEGAGILGRFDRDRLTTYLNELLRWNLRLGLVSKQDTPRVISGLIRRSVGLWDFVLGQTDLQPVERRSRVADIGSGGGFPGMVWAMLDPGLTIVLIERKLRKTAFLERVAALIGAGGVEIAPVGVGDAAGSSQYQNRFDLAAMMAVAPPGRHADDIERLLTGGGYFCTIRAETETEPPGAIGVALKRSAVQATPDGWFVLYQKPAV